MFCIHCGKQLPDDAVFCSFCGSSVKDTNETAAKPNVEQPTQTYTPNFNTNDQSAYQTAPSQNYANKKLNVAGLVGFILSCASFLFFFLDLGLIATAGMIVSIVGLSQQNKAPDLYKLKGFAIAGTAVGAVGSLIMVILVCFTCVTTCAVLGALGTL